MKKTILLLTVLLSACNSFHIGKPTVEIGGDMDGTSFVGGGGSGEIMPDHDDGSGIKVGFGTNYADSGTMEFTIVETDHDGNWAGFQTESEFRSINFDVKGSLIGSGKFRGLGILGIGFTDLTVKDGSVGVSEVKDARFSGMDFRFGVGARYQIIDTLALDFSVIQRYGSYSSVDGVVSGSVDDIDGDGITTSLEIIYIFGETF